MVLDKDVVAHEVLEALGGRGNVLSNAVCMTRLRVTVADPQIVDYELLGDVQGVLGTATRGNNGLEVVFGPRVIDDIYHAFINLTGISASIEDLFPMSRQNTSMHVQIRAGKKAAPTASASGSAHTESASFLNDSDMSALEKIFGKRESEQRVASMRLVVVNGPNLNLMGISTPEDTSDDFPALLELCKEAAEDAGFSRCDCFQSNHEGDLVDMIQDSYGIFDAIVINPGAYGSSIALRDALKAVSIPTIEVHLHALTQDDAVGTACMGSISGLGVDGYVKAIHELAAQLG